MHTIQPDSPCFIFGAGEQADHVLALAKELGLSLKQMVLFDDGFPGRSMGPYGCPIAGTMADGLARCRQEKPQAIIAIGSKGGAFRYWLYRQLQQLSIKLPSIIHPSVQIASSARVGNNCIVMAGCVLAKNVALHDLACVFSGTVLEHDTVLRCNVIMGPRVTTAGNVTIHSHTFIGAGAVISPHTTIGERVVVGAGSVVIKDIPEGHVVYGVPARVHRKVQAGDDAPISLDGNFDSI